MSRIPKFLRSATALTVPTNYMEFFQRLRKGDIFNYSEAYLYEEVADIAKRAGRVIEYLGPTTPEYREHGTFTCRVFDYCLTEVQRNNLKNNIRAAWRFLRENNSSIPDFDLDFMKNAAFEKVDTL